MRYGLRSGVLLILIAIVMCSVACCVRSPLISVIADPKSGHPCPEHGGLCVHVQCSGGQPPYLISFGDGVEITSSTGVAEHIYSPPYSKMEYRIAASCEAGVGFSDVSIENRPPIFYDIFSVKGNQAEERELVLLQVSHFTKGRSGCDECEPYRVFGGTDPDGDPLYYEWHIRKQSGAAKEDSVYDLSGSRVNGKAVQGDYFVWFPNWHEAKPPWPFSPLSSSPSGMPRLSDARLQVAENASTITPKGHYHDYLIRLTITDYCSAADTHEETWEILEPSN